MLKAGSEFVTEVKARVLESYDVVVAGRCVSATHEAFGCIRATVQCMITGEAAGAAAALCVRDNISLRKLDHGKLRATLRASGVLC